MVSHKTSQASSPYFSREGGRYTVLTVLMPRGDARPGWPSRPIVCQCTSTPAASGTPHATRPATMMDDRRESTIRRASIINNNARRASWGEPGTSGMDPGERDPKAPMLPNGWVRQTDPTDHHTDKIDKVPNNKRTTKQKKTCYGIQNKKRNEGNKRLPNQRTNFRTNGPTDQCNE